MTKRLHPQPLDDSPLGTFTPNPDLGGPPDAAFFSLLDHVSPPAEPSSFFTTSTIFRSRTPQLFSTFLSGTAKSRLHYGVATLRKHLTLERKPV